MFKIAVSHINKLHVLIFWAFRFAIRGAQLCRSLHIIVKESNTFFSFFQDDLVWFDNGSGNNFLAAGTIVEIRNSIAVVHAQGQV